MFLCEECRKKKKAEIKLKKYQERIFYEIVDICKIYNYKLLTTVSDIKNKSSYISFEYEGEIFVKQISSFIEQKGRIRELVNYKEIHKKRSATTLSKRQKSLYDRIFNICQEKNYTLITKQEEIFRNTTYIKYICPKHGQHEMRAANLINGKRCPECNTALYQKKYALSPDEVEKRFLNCGGKLLNKEDYINQTTKNLKVICNECGDTFKTSLRNFTQHGGQICSNCRKNESIGEIKIRQYLIKHKIEFIQEKWFDDCRDINPLPFDFYIPSITACIEFDGRQHFEDTNYFSFSFEKTQLHDNIKNQYCEKNNINLIRIPYWEMKNIQAILDNKLYSHKDIV